MNWTKYVVENEKKKFSFPYRFMFERVECFAFIIFRYLWRKNIFPYPNACRKINFSDDRERAAVIPFLITSKIVARKRRVPSSYRNDGVNTLATLPMIAERFFLSLYWSFGSNGCSRVGRANGLWKQAPEQYIVVEVARQRGIFTHTVLPMTSKRFFLSFLWSFGSSAIQAWVAQMASGSKAQDNTLWLTWQDNEVFSLALPFTLPTTGERFFLSFLWPFGSSGHLSAGRANDLWKQASGQYVVDDVVNKWRDFRSRDASYHWRVVLFCHVLVVWLQQQVKCGSHE